MTQAERIIGRFGGINALSRALGHRNPTTVQGWKDRGYVPANRQQEVLDLARNLGIAIAPEDFFRPEGEEAGNEASAA